MVRPVIKKSKPETHDLLKVLSHSKPKLRKAILQNCDNDLIHTICDCVYNIVKGNIPGLDKKYIKKLLPHKNTLIKLTNKIPLKEKKKTLVQKGGFLPLILPFVAPLIAKVVSKVLD